MATPDSDLQGISFTLNSHATALCFIPPESEWPVVDRLRTLYDKAARKWPPHVNLIYPFVQPDSLDAASQRIQSFLKDEPQEPIPIRLDTAGVFSQRHEKTLHIKADDKAACAETLRQLRYRILKSLAGNDAAKADLDAKSYRMHMTVAQSNSSASGNVAAAAAAETVDDVAADSSATPNDTHGHAHRFLLHKVERVPPVTWTADRLHIMTREKLVKTRGNRSDGEVIATSSRMRLWGVIHLDDGRIEKLSPAQTFYDELPFDNEKTSAEAEAEAEEANADKDDNDAQLPTFEAVTFAPEDNEWIRCSDEHDLYTSLPSVSPTPGALSVATYNVLAEFEWPPVKDRFPLLIKNLLAANAAADVLVLQEVTDHFLSALLSDSGVQSAYPFASHGPPDQEDMEPLPSLLNMVVLSRRPFSWSWLPFHRAHKGAVIARFDREDAGEDEVQEDDEAKKYGLVLATVHLTHGLTNGSVAAKRAELQRLFGHLQRCYPSHCADVVVVAGDLNIHSSSFAIEAAIRRKGISAQTARYVETGFDELFAQYGFTDAFRATQNLEKNDDDDDKHESDEAKHELRHDNGDILLYDGEEGATYNPFTNALAARIIGSGLNTRPERFDRILVRDVAKDYVNKDEDEDDEYGQIWYRITGYNSFGFPPTSEDHSSVSAYASDHWGIRCSLELADNEYEDEGGNKTLAASTTLAVSEAITEAEQPVISADIEKLIVPVEPIRAPAGPLADSDAVLSALTELGVIPSDDEIARRKAAFERLKAIVLDEETGAASSDGPRKLAVVPVGSYGLGVWTPASDIDCLCIGTFGPQTFFALAAQRLRAAGVAAANGGDAAQSVKIIRRVRAHTGTMLELEINGIRMDLQYCGAAVVAETWPAVLVLPPTHPVFALSPQTLSKLKAARDLYYIRKSFPESTDTTKICTASNLRTAHRAIKTWARARGLYVARFGYLGGIQIALLLARVMKLMQREVEKVSEDGGAKECTVADILVTFFQHYAGFDWKTKMAFDPFFHNQKSPYSPSNREPLAILGYHRPQLNTSMAASVPSVRVLAEEFQRAAGLLREGKDGITWSDFLNGGTVTAPSGLALAAGPAEFVRAYRSYIKLDLQYWGLSLTRGSAFVGWLESRCVLLLVDLARRLPDLNARIWPGRFVQANEDDDSDNERREDDNEDDNGNDNDGARQYQGCYLVGLDLPATMTREERRIALGTLQSVLAHFEKQIRRGGDGHANTGNFDPQWQWIDVSIVNRADLGNVDKLRLDERAWGEHSPGDEESEVDDDDDGNDEDDDDDDDKNGNENEFNDFADDKPKKGKKNAKNAKKLPMAVAHHPGGGKFRTAQDVIKRLRWDPHLDRSDFIVGYEDRFLGARERALESWKSEQTDEEFIPQHRILYFKRRSDDVVVWDRRTRKDDVFGSGV